MQQHRNFISKRQFDIQICLFIKLFYKFFEYPILNGSDGNYVKEIYKKFNIYRTARLSLAQELFIEL